MHVFTEIHQTFQNEEATVEILSLALEPCALRKVLSVWMSFTGALQGRSISSVKKKANTKNPKQKQK